MSRRLTTMDPSLSDRHDGDNRVQSPRRLSYLTLRCFVLKTLSDGGQTDLATLIEKIARRYGARAFLDSPRNERNLIDVINVLLLSKRFRLAPAEWVYGAYRKDLLPSPSIYTWKIIRDTKTITYITRDVRFVTVFALFSIREKSNVWNIFL